MVGFVDGHAEFMTYDAFQKALAETRENLSVDHQPAQPESSQMPTDSYSEVPQEPAEPEPTAEELEEQIQTARLQIDERGGTVVQKINLFRYHTRQYPSRLEDLLVEPNNIARREAKWRGPYATPEELEDPWGNQLRYQMPGQWNDRGYDLWSVGPDGIDNTDDDIVNW
jgi:general secretion pathway protein G